MYSDCLDNARHRRQYLAAIRRQGIAAHKGKENPLLNRI
jgi:hypothetical protein